MAIYLNDIPLNLFLEYFNETNYDGSENAPIMENLKVCAYNYRNYFSPIILQNYLNEQVLNNIKDLFAIPNLDDYELSEDKINVYETPIITNQNLDATEITKAFNNLNPNFIQENFIILKTSKEKIVYKISNNNYSLVENYEFSENVLDDKNYFPGFKMRYEIVAEKNSNSIYIEITSIPVLKPKLNSEGKNLYTDESGNIQIKKKEPNNFFRHQSAIRRAFYNLNPESSWQYKIPSNTLAIVKYNDGNCFSYHEDYTKDIKYEEVNSISEDTFVIDKFISKDEMQGSTEKYYVKQDFKKFSDYPKYKAYTETRFINENTEVYIPELDIETPTTDIKEVMLECFKRYVSIGGRKIEVNNKGRISDITLSIFERHYSNLSASIFDNETSPYIILSLFSNNDDIINNIGSTITINIGSLSITGKLIGDKNNISTVSVRFTSNTFEEAPLLTKYEIGMDNIELPDSTYFIKLNFTRVEDEKVADYLCKIKSTPKSNLDDLRFKFRNTGVNSKINDVEDLNENNSLLNKTLIKKENTKLNIITKSTGTSGALIGQELGNNFLNNATYIESTRLPSKPIPGIIGFGNNGIGINNIETILNSSNFELSTIIEKSSYYSTYNDLCKTRFNIVGPLVFDISPKSIYELVDELPNLDSNDSEYSVVEYYKNQYKDGTYLKKTITYRKTNESNISRELSSIELNKILSEFKDNNYLLNNDINNLRGEPVSGNVIYNLKLSALEDSLTDILNGSSENLNLKYTVVQENGLMRAYLYCKGRVESLRDKTTKDETFISEDLKNSDSIFNKIILSEINVKTLLESIETIKKASYRNLDKRNLINRLDTAEEYPLNKLYNDEQNEKLNFKELKNSIISSEIYENVNSRVNLSTRKKEDISDIEKIKNLIANSFTSAYLKNNLYYLNSLSLYLSKLNLSSNKSDIDDKSSYKKVYSNIDKALNADNENIFLNNILKDLLIEKSGTIMEVINGNK